MAISHPCQLLSPFVYENNLFCIAESGDVLKLNDSFEVETLFKLLGQPSCLTFNEAEDLILITDLAHQCIFERSLEEAAEPTKIISEYNSHCLLGPKFAKVGHITRI